MIKDKPKTPEQLLDECEEHLKDAKEYVEDFRFAFACFVDTFKRARERKLSLNNQEGKEECVKKYKNV